MRPDHGPPRLDREPRDEILLVAARWPHGPVHEFLDAEIAALAKVFPRVRVAPARPHGKVIGQVPDGVHVDYSLSKLLGGSRGTRSQRYSRGIRSLLSPGAQRGPRAGSTRDVATGLTKPDWCRAALMNRADQHTVNIWARRSGSPTLAYTFWLGADTIGLRRAWPRTPIVSRAHGGDIYCEAHGWASIPFQDQAVRSADLIATVSQHGRDYLGRKYPERERFIERHALGFGDLGGLAASPDGDGIRIISVSSIDTNKRVERIAEAAMHLARDGTHVHWTHLGDGPDRRRVEQRLEGSPATLTFALAGLVSHDRVAHELLHGRYSVFVNLSLSEGSPVSVMEAQCVGLAVVATDVGGTAEVAPPSWNHLIPRDAGLADIADSIRFAADFSLQAAEARRRHWLLNFDQARSCPEFADRLLRLAEQASHPL